MTKADTAADLIYKSVHPAGTWTAFRTYLDLYADLRAMDKLQEATDPPLTDDAPDKKPPLPIAPYHAPEAVPALELNADNEYAVVQGKPADAQKKKRPTMSTFSSEKEPQRSVRSSTG